MIVDDLDFHCALIRPCETDAPLVVDADAVLSLTVSAQSFQTVGARYPKIGEGRRRHNTLQSHSRSTLNFRREAPNGLSCEKALGVIIPKSVHCRLY